MDEVEQKTLQGALAVFLALAANYLGIIVVPIIVLCAVMILDYITGMIAAWKARELSSRRGTFGIVKKLCYLVAVCVGIGVDWLIYSGLKSMDVSLGVKVFFGLLVSVWLIITELISILENLQKIGVPLPGFLGKILKRLKITTEEMTNKEDKKDE